MTVSGRHASPIASRSKKSRILDGRCGRSSSVFAFESFPRQGSFGANLPLSVLMHRSWFSEVELDIVRDGPQPFCHVLISPCEQILMAIGMSGRCDWEPGLIFIKQIAAAFNSSSERRYVISELDWMREFIEGVSMEAAGYQEMT